MTTLYATMTAEDIFECEGQEAKGQDHNDVRLSVSTDAENGETVHGGLGWMNSAFVSADANKDEITFGVSIDDPRGCLTFTVRRLDDGRVAIYVPHKDESMSHVKVAPLKFENGNEHESAMVVVDDEGKPRDFSTSIEWESCTDAYEGHKADLPEHWDCEAKTVQWRGKWYLLVETHGADTFVSDGHETEEKAQAELNDILSDLENYQDPEGFTDVDCLEPYEDGYGIEDRDDYDVNRDMDGRMTIETPEGSHYRSKAPWSNETETLANSDLLDDNGDPEQDRFEEYDPDEEDEDEVDAEDEDNE